MSPRQHTSTIKANSFTSFVDFGNEALDYVSEAGHSTCSPAHPRQAELDSRLRMSQDVRKERLAALPSHLPTDPIDVRPTRHRTVGGSHNSLSSSVCRVETRSSSICTERVHPMMVYLPKSISLLAVEPDLTLSAENSKRRSESNDRGAVLEERTLVPCKGWPLPH